MRILFSIFTIAFLSAFAAHGAWWLVAVVSFMVALAMNFTPRRAFFTGFAGVALFWLTAVLLKDIPNEHILSARMAILFHLPGYAFFMLVTVFIGGLTGGLGGWSGSLVRRMF